MIGLKDLENSDIIQNLQELKIRLAQTIQVEDFEKAAEIRDKIREIENKGK